MAYVDMDGNQNLYSLTQRGQSTVEYILLLIVVVSLVNFVLKSSLFLDLMGENGQFAQTYKNQIEYSYQHGRRGNTPFTTPNYSSGSHDTYNSRFFGPTDAYPQP